MRSFLPHPAIHHPLRIAGSILLLFACLVLLGSPWLATYARLQAAEPPESIKKEKKGKTENKRKKQEL